MNKSIKLAVMNLSLGVGLLGLTTLFLVNVLPRLDAIYRSFNSERSNYLYQAYYLLAVIAVIAGVDIIVGLHDLIKKPKQDKHYEKKFYVLIISFICAAILSYIINRIIVAPLYNLNAGMW